MIYQKTKAKIEQLATEFQQLKNHRPEAFRAIAMSELPEMVYNSNAIENSTLTLKDTEDILIRDLAKKDHDVREIYEAKNLAEVTEIILKKPDQNLTIEMILALHKILLTGIRNDYAGRFRSGREWVQVGNHIGANPDFTNSLMAELVKTYHQSTDYFLDKIAYFHAEIENIHPFCDGNGRMGRVLINQQLLALDLPPIIIRGKTKRTNYYPLFDEYLAKNSADGFTELFAILLMEALNKYISMMSARKIILLKDWANQTGISPNIALNKAKRQTIPAFRLREKWHMNADFNDF
jgi:Fic family protein